jgi:hypothetical protein
MNKILLAIENLEMANRARMPENGATLPDAEHLQLCRDIILADLGRRTVIDHNRLAAVERMLAFILNKNVVEGRRRPSPAEASALGKDVSNFVVTRSWLEEFQSGEPAALRSEEKNGEAIN